MSCHQSCHSQVFCFFSLSPGKVSSHIMSKSSIVLTKLSSTMEEGIANLKLVEQPRKKQLGPKEVRIAIDVAALNYFDLLILMGRYQMKPVLVCTYILYIYICLFVDMDTSYKYTHTYIHTHTHIHTANHRRS
jgi:hypothetical protein